MHPRKKYYLRQVSLEIISHSLRGLVAAAYSFRNISEDHVSGPGKDDEVIYFGLI